MTPMLQIVIAVVLVALAAALIPLLLQLRRTAAAVQKLAESARVDLNSMARDVQQVRLRVDEVADLAAASMSLPAALGAFVGNLSRTLPSLFGQQASGWIGMLISGFRLVMEGVASSRKAKQEAAADGPVDVPAEDSSNPKA